MDDVFSAAATQDCRKSLFAIAFPTWKGLTTTAGRYSQVTGWESSFVATVRFNDRSLTLSSVNGGSSWNLVGHVYVRTNQRSATGWIGTVDCNLFKWFTLYDHAPADDSWVWRWFPYEPQSIDRPWCTATDV
jgi:hypothetical protein